MTVNAAHEKPDPPQAPAAARPETAGGGDLGAGGGKPGAGRGEPGAGDEPPRWLSTRQAADLLGVRRETVYAYVSRGVLRRYPGADKRSSRFSRTEVERLAARHRPGGRAGSLEVVLDTELTLLDPAGGLYYRGQDALKLARTTSFEQVAELLWGTEAAEAEGGWAVPAPALAVVRRAVRALPPGARITDRMRVAVAALAGTDAVRDDRRPQAVTRAARAAIAAAVDGLPGRTPAGGHRIAERLWSRLADRPATSAELRTLNAALVLLADHELAASTLAARIAASAWADPYLVLLTGLGTGGGALHGAVATGVETLLRAAPTPDQARTLVAERLRAGERIPGFGHKVYADRDPRADLLLDLVRRCRPRRTPAPPPGRSASPPRQTRASPHLAGSASRRRSVDAVVAGMVALMAERGLPPPNIDLALGALVVKLGLLDGSGEAIFLLSRMAGVIGHALEEYPQRLRFRPRALYTGPMPT